MKNIRMYSYSLLSVFLWVVLIYIPFVYFSPRGYLLKEYVIYACICCAVLFLSFLMTLVYKLFSLIKKISSLKKDIIFVLCISYLYLPISIFTMYMEGMVSSIFSMEMMHILFNFKLYILGVAIAPAPFLFVYLLCRAERQTSPSKS